MAAPIAPLPLIMGGASLLGNVFKTIGERKRQKDAERALAKMEYQELQNVANDLGVSTLGAENRTRETSRNFATSIDALRSSGTRGVVGGVSSLVSASDEVNKDIAGGLDEQRKRIEKIKAIDDIRIRGIQEARTTAEIEGLSAEMHAGREGVGSGLTGAFSSLGTIAASLFPEEETTTA